MRAYDHFPEIGFVVDCHGNPISLAVTGRGPGSDLMQFWRALARAVSRARIGTLLADFDAAWVHAAARRRPGAGLPAGG